MTCLAHPHRIPAQFAGAEAVRHDPPANSRWMAPNEPGILIVNPDRFHAELVRETIAPAFREAEISIVTRAAAALALLRDRCISLALVGLSLPDVDGLDLLAAIGRDFPATRVLVVSERTDERTRTFLRTVPVRGYFDCTVEASAALQEAARRVADGGAFCSATLFCSERNTNGNPLQRLLTATQLRVFAMIGDGSDDPTAAKWLNVSPATVQSHRRQIMRKLGVQSRAGLIKAAWTYGMVRLGENGRVLHPGFDWPAGGNPVAATRLAASGDRSEPVRFAVAETSCGAA